MKKVSVIIPVFNTAAYLENCIMSVLRQTYSNIEIILVNDGSTDNSLEICKAYAEEYSNILILDKPNTGQADSRYEGFKVSSGDYIYCVDSDDFIDRDAINTLVCGLESTDADMYFCRFRLVDETGKHLKETPKYKTVLLKSQEEIVKDALLALNIKASLCIKLCKRAIWEKCYSEEVKQIHFNEDYLLTVLFSLASKKVAFSNKVIYNALQRRGSVSRNVRPAMLLSHDKYFNIIEKELCQVSCNQSVIEYMFLGYAKNLYYSMMIIAIRSLSFNDYASLYQQLTSASLYYKNDYRKTLWRSSKKYFFFDFLSRRTVLFYLIINLFSFLFTH